MYIFLFTLIWVIWSIEITYQKIKEKEDIDHNLIVDYYVVLGESIGKDL